jgi:hypothetical protein
MIRPPQLSGKLTSSHLVAKKEEHSEEIVNFVYQVSRSYSYGSLSCRKILRHGTDGFTSPPKEVVLRILSPLEIHRPRPGLNLRTLGPMVSTVITRPPRTTNLSN